jgi:hypothetical protein
VRIVRRRHRKELILHVYDEHCALHFCSTAINSLDCESYPVVRPKH